MAADGSRLLRLALALLTNPSFQFLLKQVINVYRGLSRSFKIN